MNDILVIHEQRACDKKQINEGLQIKSLKHNQFWYFERERHRQKKENLIISQLKKINHSFNHNQLKKTFFSTALKIMNSYLHENQKVKIQPQKIIIDTINTEQTVKSQKTSDNYESLEIKNLQINSQRFSPKSTSSQQKMFTIFDEDEISNFYQTYINLYVNFFNIKAQQNAKLIKLDKIRSIIRPNNKFVIVDLLKSLMEFARNDFRLLIKQVFSDENIKLNFSIKKSNRMLKIQLNDIEEIQEMESTVNLWKEQKINRRVQTEPEAYTNDLLDEQLKNENTKLNFDRKLNKRQSIVNLLKKNSTQLLRVKTDQNQAISNHLLHAHFIDTNIRQTIFERNQDFISHLNLQKLESRVNSLYIQLTRLNSSNSQIINKFYEQSLGKKNKFNYDQRGLYSQNEIQNKKEALTLQIKTFKSKKLPRLKSTSIELTQYALQFTKNKQKSQELRQLSKMVKVSQPISNWLPLRIQYSTSIVEPLRLQIQEINQNTGELICYPWRKYRKPYSIIEFFRQKLKAQFQKVIANNLNTNKNLESEIFKKKKFKKSLFVDNRKKINELLLSNNVIYTKRESIFPVIKGIQENYIKNSSNLNSIINQNINILENPTQKNKDLKYDLSQRKINNLSTTKQATNHKSKDQQKRFDSMKKITTERQNYERKTSESQKIFQRLSQKEVLQRFSQKEKQKCDFLCRLSTKRQTPKSITNRSIQKQLQRYEKKNLISMSKIMDLKSQGMKGQSISRTLQVSTLTGKKITVLNLS